MWAFEQVCDGVLFSMPFVDRTRELANTRFCLCFGFHFVPAYRNRHTFSLLWKAGLPRVCRRTFEHPPLACYHT